LANLATTEEKNPVESFRITPSEATGAAIKKVLLYYVQEVTDALEKSGKETDPIEMSYQFCDSLRRMKAVLSFSHNLINLSCDNEVLQDIGKIADESSSWHDINISRGEYVPTVFEFWAWILKNWEEQKDTMTISEYTENWFSTWVDIYLNIDIQKILNDPELIISFDKSIVEARYILEEFQAIIQKNSSELIQILKEMHERLAQDEQDKSIDKSRKNVQLLWPVLVAELSKTSSPYDDGKGDD
jgi:hypothetical protein